MGKLEPCPICNLQPEHIHSISGVPFVNMMGESMQGKDRYSITCMASKNNNYLGHVVRVTRFTKAEAIEAWNTRAKSVPLSTQAALDCTIEHLDGIHTGKIVVDIDVFNTLYEAARESLE